MDGLRRIVSVVSEKAALQRRFVWQMLKKYCGCEKGQAWNTAAEKEQGRGGGGGGYTAQAKMEVEDVKDVDGGGGGAVLNVCCGPGNRPL